MGNNEELIRRANNELMEKHGKGQKKEIKDLMHMIGSEEKFGCAFVYHLNWLDRRSKASAIAYMLLKDASLCATKRGSIVLEGQNIGDFFYEGFHFKYEKPKPEDSKHRGIVVHPYNELFFLESFNSQSGEKHEKT